MAYIDIETPRIVLRRWGEADLAPFITLNADPQVMRYFPAVRTVEHTTFFFERIQQEFADYGYGLYVAEEKATGLFMGFIGFHHPEIPADICPGLEIGWRLAKAFWGKGYATEGAAACLRYGFAHLGFTRVYSFTAVKNGPSQRVMQKSGMKLDRYFDHPNVAESTGLRQHVLYVKDAAE